MTTETTAPDQSDSDSDGAAPEAWVIGGFVGLPADVELKLWPEHHTGRPGWYTAGRGVFVGAGVEAIATCYTATRLRLQAAGYTLAAPHAAARVCVELAAAQRGAGDAAALAAAEAELAAVRELPPAQRGPCYREIFDAAADRVMLLHQTVRHGAGKAQAIADAFCAVAGDGIGAVVASPTLTDAAASARALAAAEVAVARRRRPAVAVDGRPYSGNTRRPAEVLLSLSCGAADGDLMAAARAVRACAHYVAAALLERPDAGDGNVVEVLPGAHRSVDGAAYCLLRVMVAVSEAPGVIASAREVAAEWSATAIDRRA